MIILSKLRELLIGPQNESIESLRKRGVRVGEDVAIYNSDIDGGYGFLIDIGNRVTITNATILTHDASTKRALGYAKVGRVSIGDDTFIGYGSIVLPGVSIGQKVIVGAGSVVREDIPDNCVVTGNPARVVCSTDEYIERNREKMAHMPIFDTHWSQKSEEDKEAMKKQLMTTMGFNV